MTVFLRLVDVAVDDKVEALLVTVGRLRGAENENMAAPHFTFERQPNEFTAIPGSPFAYWAPKDCINVFTRNDPMNRDGRLVVSTNPLNADFRFVRLWWEPSPDHLGIYWRPWAKGGAYSPYYYDIDTVISWSDERQSYSGFLGTQNRPLERPASVQHFFRSGLTWPRRTQGGLGLRLMPAGCIFADKGPAVFVDNDNRDNLLALLAITTSSMFRYLVELQMAFGSYEVGVIQRTPVPHMSAADTTFLATLTRRAWSIKRSLDTANETSHAFVLPPGLNEQITGLDRTTAERELEAIQNEIDDAAFSLYRINSEDRGTIEKSSIGAIAPDIFEGDEADDGDNANHDETPVGLTADALKSWLVGCAFFRFDPRFATRERHLRPEPEPFDPLPSRSPGMWPEAEEPARRLDILVDDEGHADDLVALMRVASERVRVHAPENLRAWLANEFFPLHIKMYSKSRRKAPIYWQLATPSANYSVWLYIHAFTKDTLFRVQNDYVVPKLAQENRRLESMKGELGVGGTTAQRKEMAAQEAFVEDLRAFLEEFTRVAPLWNPNLDDGVIINFAPLWRLVPQHKAWQKELEATWDALCEGKYDWSHLAMHLWPERVIPKCASDRSLAIAHELEFAFWEEDAAGIWKERETLIWPIEEVVAKRSSAAVKAALKSLLDAPGAGRATKRGRKSRAA